MVVFLLANDAALKVVIQLEARVREALFFTPDAAQRIRVLVGGRRSAALCGRFDGVSGDRQPPKLFLNRPQDNLMEPSPAKTDAALRRDLSIPRRRAHLIPQGARGILQNLLPVQTGQHTLFSHFSHSALSSRARPAARLDFSLLRTKLRPAGRRAAPVIPRRLSVFLLCLLFGIALLADGVCSLFLKIV